MKRLIEVIGEHPFVTGLLAIVSLTGFVLSVFAYVEDRQDARKSTNDAERISREIAALELEKRLHEEDCQRRWEAIEALSIKISEEGESSNGKDQSDQIEEQLRERIGFMRTCPDQPRVKVVRSDLLISEIEKTSWLSAHKISSQVHEEGSTCQTVLKRKKSLFWERAMAAASGSPARIVAQAMFSAPDLTGTKYCVTNEGLFITTDSEGALKEQVKVGSSATPSPLTK